MSSGATVRVTGASRTFNGGATRIAAVDEVTVEFPPGSMTAITGASGSGKSTLLHLIGAIERADSGSITVDGQEITRMRRKLLDAYRRTVGFVFQRYHLLPTLTALDNVLAPVLPYRVRFDKTKRARDLLQAVGLAGRENALPSQLSGGEQQRVAIARALIGEPRLLLADEPSGNLDSRTGEQILELLVELRARHGITMLIATHEQHIAAYFLDGHTASARPGWVEVTGGTLSLAAAHQHKGCGSHLACGLPVTVARLWLKRGLPSSK